MTTLADASPIESLSSERLVMLEKLRRLGC